MSKQFTPSEHFVHFDGFIEEPSLVEAFEKFLKIEKHETNLQLLRFLQTMKKIEDIDESDYDSYVQMVDKTFIKTIFPSTVQTKFYSDLEKFKENKISLSQILKDLKLYALNELRYHSFPMFIRKKECQVCKIIC
jgi:hypothetical protein